MTDRDKEDAKMVEVYSPHDASERILASGRPLAPGEYAEVTAKELKEPHNKRLLDEGQLLKVPKKEGN